MYRYPLAWELTARGEMMSLSGGEVWAWGFWVRVLGAPWCSPWHLFS